MADREPKIISIWKELDPEEGFKKDHLSHLESLGIGNLPRMDETFVINPNERVKKKRQYIEEHLALDFDEAAKLSSWDQERLEKAKVAWAEDKYILPLPVAIEVFHKVIATCHAYLDAPEHDSEARRHFLDYLNLDLQARISKRKEREMEMSTGDSEYAFRRARGGVNFPGLDHLPSGSLVEILKRLEVGLKTKSG